MGQTIDQKRKHFELNEHEKIYQNLWDAAKAILRGKSIAMPTY